MKVSLGRNQWRVQNTSEKTPFKNVTQKKKVVTLYIPRGLVVKSLKVKTTELT